MHELSIITNVVDSTLNVAKQQNAESVLAINLKIGIMVDAIDEALRASFEMLSADEPMLKDCELRVAYSQPKSKCLECGEEYSHDRFIRSCPKCKSNLTELIAGNEMEIESIEIKS